MKAKKPAKRLAHRSRPLRIENDNYLWFVTSRTIEERFWLHPILSSGLQPPNHRTRRALKKFERHADKRLAKLVKTANQRRGPFQPKITLEDAKRIARGLVGSALARAQEKYHTRINSVVVMSNHIHLIVQTKGKNLSKFMGYVKSLIANTVNLLTGKSGPLWARRYDAQPILDDDGACERLVYTMDNPVNARLVDKREQWPGLNLAYGLGDSDTIDFEYLNRTQWHILGRPEDLSGFYDTVKLELSPLPKMKGTQRKLVEKVISKWSRLSQEGDSSRSSALGLEKIIHANFDYRPRDPKNSSRPYAFGTKENKMRYFEGVSRTQVVYADRSERFLSGQRNVSFPEGTYPPPIMIAA